MRSKSIARFLVLIFIFFAVILTNPFKGGQFNDDGKQIRICTLINCS